MRKIRHDQNQFIIYAYNLQWGGRNRTTARRRRHGDDAPSRLEVCVHLRPVYLPSIQGRRLTTKKIDVHCCFWKYDYFVVFVAYMGLLCKRRRLPLLANRWKRLQIVIIYTSANGYTAQVLSHATTEILCILYPQYLCNAKIRYMFICLYRNLAVLLFLFFFFL